MKLAVITECALSRKHGTGAQLLRILEGSDFVHFYLTHFYGGVSEIGRSFRLEDPRYTGRGRRHVGKVERLLGLNWWNGHQLDRRRFDRLVRRQNIRCDVAYVCIATEEQAAKANAILAELNVPYVVHVMDIYYDSGLDPATMPQLARLFRGAVGNIALSEAIRGEIAKFTDRPIELVPIGQDVTSQIAQPPSADGPINVLTVGKPYETGTRLLADAWPAIKEAVPRARLLYAGQHTSALPANLIADLDNRGYISDKQTYDQLLAECQIAYLSGPSELDKFGRFSIPSRTSDFLMAGLPLVAAVATGSATEQFLAPLVPKAARTVMDATSLVDAISGFAADVGRWATASQAARQFALQRVAMDKVREQILAALREAAQSRKSI